MTLFKDKNNQKKKKPAGKSTESNKKEKQS